MLYNIDIILLIYFHFILERILFRKGNKNTYFGIVSFMHEMRLTFRIIFLYYTCNEMNISKNAVWFIAY